MLVRRNAFIILLILLYLCSVMPASANNVTIAVTPSSTTVNVNQNFTMTVQVQAGTQQVDGAEVHITFDTAFLEVVSLSAGSTLTVPIIAPTFSNASGQIDYAAGTFATSPPSGTFDLLTITFRALASTSGTPVSFITSGFPVTVATFAGTPVLGGTQPGTVVVNGNTSPQPTQPPPPTAPPGQPTFTPVPPLQPTSVPGQPVVPGDDPGLPTFSGNTIEELCNSIAFTSGGAVTASVPGGITSRSGEDISVYCRILVNPAEIGVEDLPVAYAVDVFAFSEAGSVTQFNQSVGICLQGNGRLLFRDATGTPRTTQGIASSNQGGYTCANLSNAGTIILSPGGSSPVVNNNASSVSVPTSGTGTHTVQQGETLFRIALQYNVSVNALVAANDLNDPSRIFAGQVLIIPGGNVTSTTNTAVVVPDTATTSMNTEGQQIHIIQPGENLFRIALRYDVSLSQLAEVNGIINPRQIFAGQELIIPGN